MQDDSYCVWRWISEPGNHTQTLCDAIEKDFEDEEVNFSEDKPDDECGGMGEAHAVQDTAI